MPASSLRWDSSDRQRGFLSLSLTAILKKYEVKMAISSIKHEHGRLGKRDGGEEQREQKDSWKKRRLGESESQNGEEARKKKDILRGGGEKYQWEWRQVGWSVTVLMEWCVEYGLFKLKVQGTLSKDTGLNHPALPVLSPARNNHGHIWYCLLCVCVCVCVCVVCVCVCVCLKIVKPSSLRMNCSQW